MLEHLRAAIPDADVVLDLEPEELAAKLLFILREHGEHMFNFYNMELELTNSIGFGHELYPRDKVALLGLALREAAAWLIAQGLVVTESGANGSNGWYVLSRRAHKFENPRQFANYAAARRLPLENLHPRIRSQVWACFMRNEFDGAAFHAMKAVEVAVREASGLARKDVGVGLMRKAFDKATGPLRDRDQDAEEGEREACAHLFAGAIGTFKNPHSHRDVDLTDPAEAAEIVMLANMLLRIVDSRKPDVT